MAERLNGVMFNENVKLNERQHHGKLLHFILHDNCRARIVQTLVEAQSRVLELIFSDDADARSRWSHVTRIAELGAADFPRSFQQSLLIKCIPVGFGCFEELYRAGFTCLPPDIGMLAFEHEDGDLLRFVLPIPSVYIDFNWYDARVCTFKNKHAKWFSEILHDVTLSIVLRETKTLKTANCLCQLICAFAKLLPSDVLRFPN